MADEDKNADDGNEPTTTVTTTVTSEDISAASVSVAGEGDTEQQQQQQQQPSAGSDEAKSDDANNNNDNNNSDGGGDEKLAETKTEEEEKRADEEEEEKTKKSNEGPAISVDTSALDQPPHHDADDVGSSASNNSATSEGGAPVPAPRQKKSPVPSPRTSVVATAAAADSEEPPPGEAPPPVAKKRTVIPTPTSPDTSASPAAAPNGESLAPVVAKKPESTSPVMPRKKPEGVANIGAQLNLPLSPMGGPPAKKPEPTETPSFDKPMAEIKTLENVTRGRARPQQKRRAPSRPLKVFLIDGTYRGVALEEGATVAWLTEFVLEKMELEERPKEFGIYEVDKLGKERRLDETAMVTEILDGWGEKKADYNLFGKSKEDKLIKDALPALFAQEVSNADAKAKAEKEKDKKKDKDKASSSEDAKKPPAAMKARSKSAAALMEDAVIIGKELNCRVVFDKENGRITGASAQGKAIKPFPISIQDVIRVASATNQNMTDVALSYVVQKKKHRSIMESVIVKFAKSEMADGFVSSVRESILPLGPTKSILFLVNPNSGKKKSKKIFEKYVQPVLTAAEVKYSIKYTERSGHAREIAQSLRLEDQDAIVAVSGSGLVNEVINGLLNRKDWQRAVLLPLGIIPAGSGNGLACSIYGPDKAVDATAAILSILRGISSPVDCCSISQENERRFTFLSQSYGLIAESNAGAEKFKFMGEASKFAMGALKSMTSNKQKYTCKLSLLVASNDKAKIAKGDYSVAAIPKAETSTTATTEANSVAGASTEKKKEEEETKEDKGKPPTPKADKEEEKEKERKEVDQPEVADEEQDAHAKNEETNDGIKKEPEQEETKRDAEEGEKKEEGDVIEDKKEAAEDDKKEAAEEDKKEAAEEEKMESGAASSSDAAGAAGGESDDLDAEEKKKLAARISESLNIDSAPSSPVVESPPAKLEAKTVEAPPAKPPVNIPKMEGPPLTLPWVTETLPSSWKTFDEEIHFVCAGKSPYAAIDCAVTPYANATDSLLDVCLLRAQNTARNRATEITRKLETGSPVNSFNEVEYFKVMGYRMELAPNPKGLLTVDGEKWNFATFQVEVHPKLVQFMFPAKNQGKYIRPNS